MLAPAGALDGPSYSATLVNAFARYLASLAGVEPSPDADVDPDTRILAVQAHGMLAQAVESTGNASLGLAAARSMNPGEVGAADYVVGTAPTVRDALIAVGRYFRLVNDAVEPRLSEADGRAVLEWHAQIVMPRAAEDFLMAAVFWTQLRSILGEGAGLECRFTYPAPDDVEEHRRTFGAAALVFSAARAGYAFDAACLDRPVPGADKRLHGVLLKHADALLQGLPATRTLTDRVRQHLIEELPRARPTADTIARRLHMSVRTLDRRLLAEGTSFGAVLDDLRRRLALEYLGRASLSLSEIAFLLGFAHVGAFHRAFKRWTGTTPLEHRRGAR